MNLTMTRAAQTACAEPGFALRRIHHNPTVAPERSQRSHDVQGFGAATVEVRRDLPPDGAERETLGMVLLGIGYETSIA